MTKVMDNIEACIGNTPIVELKHALVPSGKKLLLKLEAFNPTFSIKDRTAIGLVRPALDQGKLKLGGILIESTSGNLGKSLAMLGAMIGFRVILVVDPKVSSSLLNWYKAYGAEVVIVHIPDALGGYQGPRLQKVQELLKQHPDAYWPNQYDNKDNPDFHYATTALEIAELDTDAVIGAVSTGGHFCGIARQLKEQKVKKTTVACDVAGSAVFGGNFKPYLINGIGLAWRSQNVDFSVLDKVCIISDQEAISINRLLARETGILMGGSGGLVVFAALAWLSQSLEQSALAIIPDAGVNYLDQFYDDKWLAEKNITLLKQTDLQHRILAKSFLNNTGNMEHLAQDKIFLGEVGVDVDTCF